MIDRRHRSAVVTTLLCAAATGPAVAQIEPHPGMLRYPDVGKDRIVFVYANDLWTAPREGGLASPLASPPGQEVFPKFSPDGQTIAFGGNYDGGRDLYTIPVTGGIPHRVTHHPTGEILSDWTPEGDLLFFAYGIQGHARAAQIFTVDADGGVPEQLPVPYGTFASISSDGWLAYTPNSRETRSWKRYRGGLATDIWLFHLQTHESRQITDWEGTDALPMWYGKTLYYLSDAGPNHRLNIWSYDPQTDEHEQITDFKNFDVKWPSIGPGPHGMGEIIFQCGPAMYLLDLNLEAVNEVTITIPGARPTIRTKRVDVRPFIMGGNISSTGKRAVLEARGDIWTLPAEKGSPRNLTNTDGVAERSGSWSPDGRWIAYFSDKTGEYELYITQSDGKGETKQLTEGHKTFFYNPIWSPDSKHILFFDKAAQMYLHTLESGETRIIDKDPWGMTGNTANWSHDSRWITYARTEENNRMPAIHLYDVENDEHHKVTSGMFPDQSPVFDRKGDYLYFASSRSYSPTYGDLDQTWIYDGTQVLIAVPLRKDVEAPWKLETDEEEWEEEAAQGEGEEGGGEDANGDAGAEDEGSGEGADDEEGDEHGAAAAGDESGAGDEAAADEADAPHHPLHGVWEGSVSGLRPVLEQMIPPDAGIEIPDTAPYTLNIVVDDEGNISGTSTMELMGQTQTEPLGDVTFNEETGEYLETDEKEGVKSVMKGKLEDNTLSGTWELSGLMNGSGNWSVTKTDVEPEEVEKPAETVEIDLDGFEQRGFMLPVGSGNFGQLAVNDKNQLLYTRFDGVPSIKLFDLKDESKSEKNVVTGAAGFYISADGKKILYQQGTGAAIANAAAGAAGKPVPMEGLTTRIDPREEWEQIFNDAWRIQRDFFYVDNMHGVDWPAIRDRYAAMLDDCVTREDVSFVIAEMIGELNIGHAYYFGGDVEGQPFTGVGMLGVDFELDNGAYRIKKIHHGGAWDVDARNPLMNNGSDVKEGDYLLAVNGMELDPDVDPWAPFIGLAGRTVTLTVSDKPEIDDDAREIVVQPMSSEGTLRYRSWIEANRKHVEEKTDGRIGYIYVPNTSVSGQDDLYRQFVGQMTREGLIIDERWNGGGQIPTRFIEMLNRPVTNYWARRDNHDWKWPPFAHNGPKCMLINGNAGSGGDMFPWLFRSKGLGKLIGTRTWGGLVGISGNPPLIDGGYTSAPTFGFYEKNGTWGVEGYGVAPDIRVIDDPAEMLNGADPQLDAAIEHMLVEIKEHPYVPPKRPNPPDRSGMGIREEDK